MNVSFISFFNFIFNLIFIAAHLLAILIQEITKLTYISNLLTLVVNAILNNVGYFDEQSLSTIIQYVFDIFLTPTH